MQAANDVLLISNSDAGAACLQLQDVAARDEATIQELQELLEEQQRQQAEAGVTMAAAEQQLQQISQRTLQLGHDIVQRQGQIDDLQVPCMSHVYCSSVDSILLFRCSCAMLIKHWLWRVAAGRQKSLR